jgi:hypothetical protein
VCDRNINDGNWSNRLQNFRFSVSNSGDSYWLPALSYFVLEYSFGSANGKDGNYTATEALKQSQKITLANDWVSSMYTAASLRKKSFVSTHDMCHKCYDIRGHMSLAISYSDC